MTQNKRHFGAIHKLGGRLPGQLSLNFSWELASLLNQEGMHVHGYRLRGIRKGAWQQREVRVQAQLHTRKR